MRATSILVFACSTRPGSHNQHLGRLAAELLEHHGTQVPQGLPLPIPLVMSPTS